MKVILLCLLLAVLDSHASDFSRNLWIDGPPLEFRNIPEIQDQSAGLVRTKRAAGIQENFISSFEYIIAMFINPLRYAASKRVDVAFQFV